MAKRLSCHHCERLLADYVLEILARGAVTEHLRTCARCQAQCAAYEAVVAHLGQAVPQQDPPAEGRARLLAAACEEA
jgi:anti-sigma factor RsiW